MSVDVVRHDASENVLVGKTAVLLDTVQKNERNNLTAGLTAGITGVFVLVLIFVCLCTKRRKRKTVRDVDSSGFNSTGTTTSSGIYSIPIETGVLRTPQDVARRYERSVSALSSKEQVYLIPFSALPPDFDYSSREVEVKGDFVILKDLSLLERYNNSPVDYGGVVNEAYERQEPYNPYVYTNIPSQEYRQYNPLIYGTVPPLEHDTYKKQLAYNPTFY
ncbi:uncharacterized protein [Euwallacea fornicatus]|uniref:uncharacterized protein n=1 Tax=Euwallacea fornicatus TaxID=995702 RepID=UPI0033903A3D